MAGICPIFEKIDQQNVNLVGLWVEIPSILDFAHDNTKALQIAFMEAGHWAPELVKFYNTKNCRTVKNTEINVGNGCKFISGVFIMGQNNPAPNEKNGLPDKNYNYSMKLDNEVTILIREKLSNSESNPMTNKKKRWWQFGKKKTHKMSKDELRNLLLGIERNFSKEDEKAIINEGKEITSLLAELTIEFDPDNFDMDKFVVARTAAYLIGEIGYLDFTDAEKIFNQLIKDRTPAESVQNNWNGVFSETADMLKNLGHIK